MSGCGRPIPGRAPRSDTGATGEATGSLFGFFTEGNLGDGTDGTVSEDLERCE